MMMSKKSEKYDKVDKINKIESRLLVIETKICQVAENRKYRLSRTSQIWRKVKGLILQMSIFRNKFSYSHSQKNYKR